MTTNDSTISNAIHLAENNHDWAATCAIYAGVETPRVEPLEKGFQSHLTIPIATSNIVFAYKCSSDSDEAAKYRCYTLQNDPVLSLAFDYVDASQEEEQELVTPRSVLVSWRHYPKEWPYDEKLKLLTWLQEHSIQLLEETKMSFSVCEFCEHETLASYWKLFAKDSTFQLILLPPKIDQSYHTTYGLEIQLQIKDEKQESGSKKNSKTEECPLVNNAMEYAKRVLCQRWKELVTVSCPICFDNVLVSSSIALPPCNHYLCQDCWPQYVHFTVQDITNHRTNPFCCPIETCRKKLNIPSFIKCHLSKEDWKTVLRWKKHLKYPLSRALDRCLSSKLCGSRNCLLKTSVGSNLVFCEDCKRIWCELCLKRVPRVEVTTHTKDDCDFGSTTILKFCRRYMRASNELKEKCQDKYPWIASYAIFRQSDGEAISWVRQNGQRCPTCQTGVERTEGCFHMQCPDCKEHFCYECGDVLQAPFYGTHHCWERTELLQEEEEQAAERVVEEYQFYQYQEHNDLFYWDDQQNGFLFGQY